MDSETTLRALSGRRVEMSEDREVERLARAGLSLVVEPGDANTDEILAGGTAAEAWDRLRGGGPGHEQYAARLAVAAPAKDLGQIHMAGGRFVIPGDDDWPDQLDVLAESGEISRRGGSPFGLWVRGAASLRELTTRSVAVVGARACSAYGEHVAGELGAGLADEGVTVVSGGAYGIDAAAHRGALAAPGPTIAVLACGADVGYPKGNAALFDRIVADGLVISELPPGCSPTRLRFLARNRLIAALTAGTVVVEAAARSGALNTGSWAERCSRVVMAVPGPVTSSSSHGAHILIREKGAVLVTGVADILEAIAPLGQHLTRYPRGETRPTDRLSEVAQRVLDAVPIGRAVTVGTICRTAGLSDDAVGTGLDELTHAGLIEKHGTAWRLSRQRTEEIM
jgi:DNA processing protein